VTTIIDTSGVFAAMDTDASDHVACLTAINTLPQPLVVSPMVVAELDYLTCKRFGIDAAIAFLGDVRNGAYELATADDDDFAMAFDVVKQYRDLNIGITDALNVALAEKYETARIFTLDGHYRAVRAFATGDSFTLLPADS
jgi:uncharacterized protein